MATITARKRKDGTRYTAQIRLKRDGKIIHTESATFAKKTMAVVWAAKREDELASTPNASAIKFKGVTVGQVLQWYLDDYNQTAQFGRSKLAHLKMMLSFDLAGRDAISLKPSDIIRHIRERRAMGVQGCTAGNDLIWLRTAFKRVRPTRDIPLNLQVIEDAAALCYAEKLIGKANSRSRRPTLDELNRLLDYFSKRSDKHTPMVTLILFAIFSARRLDEICRLRWDDVDYERSSGLVRDMKSPKGKGNHVRVLMTDEAMKIIRTQPVKGELIFPYNPKSISSAFTKACKIVGIVDLHFHDLRHEGTSRLFELGWDIPRVAAVTGHRGWDMLRRYTQLHGLGIVDKYAGWAWLPE